MCAGVRELANRREMLGGELRDVFDAHPPRKLAKEERKQLGMTFGTQGRHSSWPYGIEWLNDTYPIPYWVRQQMQEAAAASTGGATDGGSGSTAPAKAGKGQS